MQSSWTSRSSLERRSRRVSRQATRPLPNSIYATHSSLARTANTVTFKDSSSTSQLSQISLGTLASGETLAAPFTLLAEGLSGSRALDIMLHSRIPAASASTSSPPSPSASPDVSFEDDPLLPPPFETLHSLTIPFSGPMSVAFSSRILPSRRQDSAQLLAAEAFAADAVDLDGQAILSARVDMVGSADIVVEAMELRPGVSRLSSSSRPSSESADTRPFKGPETREKDVLLARCGQVRWSLSRYVPSDPRATTGAPG